ncbi:MAG: PEGA domain-containing protein [Deltaproteobacteria bacterium]|nr:PEGA domain-containing protein [Deltaproteobacteria bacterium]
MRSIWSAFGLLLVAALALLPPSEASAAGPVQTFFVVLPEATAEVSREALETCGDRFAASLVGTGAFRANQDAETQRSVSDCLGSTASATTKRACEVSMANIEVDYLIRMVARRIGADWSWSLKALEPASGAAQIWGSDDKPAGLADPAEAAYVACDKLGRAFACAQGIATACGGAGLGTGPLLVDGDGAATSTATTQTAVTVSALDIIRPTPAVVSVWIDGREAGSSSNQITGITPGPHEVALKATGFMPYTETILFEAGKPAKLRNIQLVSTTSRLLVTLTAPQSATLRIDGREVGTTGEVIAGIEPGRRTVLLRAEGYQDYTGQLSFEAGKQTERLDVAMTPLPATLELAISVMGAEIAVDGRVVAQSLGQGLLQRLAVASGERTVTITAEDYLPVTRTVALSPGGTLRLDLGLQRDDPEARAARAKTERDAAIAREREAAAAQAASQPPTSGENCYNGVDDDRDGLADCADPLCAGAAGCAASTDDEGLGIILRAHGSIPSVGYADFTEDVSAAAPGFGGFSGSVGIIGGSIGLLDEPGGLEHRLDYQQFSASSGDLDHTGGIDCSTTPDGSQPLCSSFSEFSAQSLSYLIVEHDSEPVTIGLGLGLFEHAFDAESYETGISLTFLIEALPLDADWAKAGIVLRTDFLASAGGNSLLLASLQWGGGFDF